MEEEKFRMNHYMTQDFENALRVFCAEAGIFPPNPVVFNRDSGKAEITLSKMLLDKLKEGRIKELRDIK